MRANREREASERRVDGERKLSRRIVEMGAVEALLGRILEYAGLFPPAGLEMESALRNYQRIRKDGRILDPWGICVARHAAGGVCGGI
jgi:hypothetical protein